ncbi:MAG: hypothetical protein M8861_13225 [marine benthic group bacterium]|nr:hypothetical protein [Gemmatimonadota bacterium]
MARVGKEADREHSGHYLSAVAVVAVAVAGMAWFGQNRTLAAAAAALGLYALHLFSIRFLLDNQKRQQRVLDAQWEVLQRFIDTSDTPSSDMEDLEDLVPAMPVDREAPEHLPEGTAVLETVHGALESELQVTGDTPTPEVEPDVLPVPDVPQPEAPQLEVERSSQPVVRDEVVPPVESLGGAEPGYAIVMEDDAVESLSAIPGLEMSDPSPPTARTTVVHESHRATLNEVPVPRHFALGTVALVRDLLTPAEVARVLLEQRRQAGKKFGVLAVEMGLLSESQREELLLAQQEGLFTDAEMRDARQRLRQFRESAAHSMAGLD